MAETPQQSRSRRGLLGALAAIAVAAAVAVAVVVIVGGGDEVVVAGTGGAQFDVREGDRVRVAGTVREADYATETGDRDGIAFETDNAIFADTVEPAPGAGFEGADLDLEGPDRRGDRVTVVGEVAEIDDDRRSFVLEFE